MPGAEFAAGDEQEERNEREEQKDGEDEDERAKLPPVELGQLLDVLDHDLARQLALAFGPDAERKGDLGDARVRDLRLEEEVERDLEPVRVERARL